MIMTTVVVKFVIIYRSLGGSFQQWWAIALFLDWIEEQFRTHSHTTVFLKNFHIICLYALVRRAHDFRHKCGGHFPMQSHGWTLLAIEAIGCCSSWLPIWAGTHDTRCFGSLRKSTNFRRWSVDTMAVLHTLTMAAPTENTVPTVWFKIMWSEILSCVALWFLLGHCNERAARAVQKLF